MECGWGSPEQMAVCIDFAQRWFPLFLDLTGLGSLALIGVLLWFVRRLRKDVSKWQEELKHANELRQLAEEAARHAEHVADLAERQANRDRRSLEECRKDASRSEDDLSGKLVACQSQREAKTKQIEEALELTAGGTEAFWSSPVGNRFASYKNDISGSIPIVMFGNQKGGVGKTTVVTNLAASFASRGERVLTVDLDYQGSHSSLMELQSGRKAEEPESLIDFIFEEELDQNWDKLVLRKAAANLHYIPAWYNFELVERSVEYRWALGRTKDDVRYRLARALLSTEIQEKFDRILIDAPPRFTLGFVNGFCAATHIYVPTVVDRLSARAVGTFARQFMELRAVVNPVIRWSGIIGTMTFVNTSDVLKLPGTAKDAADRAELAAQARLGTKEDLFIRKPVIRRDKDLAHATEEGIAYLNDSGVRPMFDLLAMEIERKAPSKRNRT